MPHSALVRPAHEIVPVQAVGGVQVQPAPTPCRFWHVVPSSMEQGLAIVPPHMGIAVSS